MNPAQNPPRCLCKEIPLKDSADISTSCIGGIWILDNLGPEERMALAKTTVRKVYEEGEHIFSQGDPLDKVFLLKAGLVKLTKLMEDGTAVILGLGQAGDFLGINMFGEDVEYPVSAVCLKETLICGFTKEGFEGLVLQYPRIGLQVIKNLGQRISQLGKRIESMSLTGLEERLYQTLLNIALEYGIKSHIGLVIRFPLTHEDLGFLLGAHRVSISRAMKELRKTGSIIQDKRSIILRERNA